MKFTVDSILKNTDDDELFCLFGEYLNRLVEKPNTHSGLKVEDIVYLDRHKFEVIKEMKKFND